MGLVHDTGSSVLGVETRRDSVILRSRSDGNLFFWNKKFTDFQGIIVSKLMDQAGEKYAGFNREEAEKLRAIAETVKNIKVDNEPDMASFEASKEWVKSLLKFFNENPDLLD